MSLAAAESMATYLFWTSYTEGRGVNHLYNLPPIVLHFILFSYLLMRTRRSSTESGDAASQVTPVKVMDFKGIFQSDIRAIFGRGPITSLTPRSSGAPTAGHQARSGGTQYIFTSPA